MGGRSRANHHIPPQITFSGKFGGRREVKFFTFIATYSASGPATLQEGQQGTYNFSTDGADATYQYSVSPSARVTAPTGTFVVTGGLGSFTLSAASNATTSDTADVTVSFIEPAGDDDTVLTTIVTSISDMTPAATVDAGLHEFFDYGATWKYYDSDADPGAFTSTSYDDSSWSSGPGELGFGDSDEATTINQSTTNASYAFRKTVNFPGGSQLDEIDYKILFDDGVVVYINGDEQIRSSNWSAGAISWGDFATSTISDNFVITGTIPASAWVDGDNVIAVQVSNNAGTSSDVSFNMGLTGEKFEPYTVSGPSSVNEGSTSTSYQLDTTQGDGTYYYSVHPTGEFVEQNGSFTVTGGTGTFTLSAAPDGVEDGDQLVAVDFRTDSTSGTIVGTVSTTVVDVDGGAVAGWVSFQEGTDSYAGTTDTYVQSGANEATGRGANTSVVIDKNASNERFAFVKFDDIENAFIDNTAVTVVSAGMTVTINSEGQGVRVYKANEAFAESTTYSTIGTRLNGGSTDGTTGYPASAMSDPTVVLDNDGYTGESLFELDASTVQEWINNPSANHGMVFVADHSGDGIQFRTSEWGTVSQRPMLTIAYTE